MRFKLAVLAVILLSACHKKDPDPEPQPVVPAEPTKPDTDQPAYTVIQSDPSGLKYHTGLIHKKDEIRDQSNAFITLDDCDNLPDEFDLRPLGLVSDIRDQGSCGSCWAFSMTNSLESALLGQGQKLNLSEQELVSCDTAQWGCNGGLLNDFKYQINHGQGIETDFPYTARDSRCKAISPAAKGISFAYIGAANRAPTEKELKCALYKFKTVPWITVSASNAWGSPPASEHTAYSRCGRGQTNHAVGVVGWWKDRDNKTQFIMKNSWGTGWGDKGYMSLPLGCDNFGEEVAFIQVARAPDPTPTPPGPTPTPNPCVPPAFKLPKVIVVEPGAEVMLGVKENPTWQMKWYVGANEVGQGAMLYVMPTADTVYKLVATNSCGRAEGSVKVSLLVSRR